MATLGAMKARIADELARSNLTSQIALAITSAIDFYAVERFWFNEAVGSFSTVAGQEWYTAADDWDALANVLRFDSLRLTINSTPYRLTQRPMEWMERASVGTSMTGEPTDWCFYREQLRFYPVPNASRTVTVSYVAALAALSSDANDNAWTTEAEELIRLHAKVDLMTNVIREKSDEAAMLEAREAMVLRRLRARTAGLVATGMIQPESV